MTYLAKMHKSLADFQMFQERIKREEAKGVDRGDIDSLRREFLSTLRRLRDKIPRMYFRESFALEEFRSDVVGKLFESSKPEIEMVHRLHSFPIHSPFMCIIPTISLYCG
jgi:hypothetical protein